MTKYNVQVEKRTLDVLVEHLEQPTRQESKTKVTIIEITVDEWFNDEPTVPELFDEARKRGYSLVSPRIALQDASHRLLHEGGAPTWLYYAHERIVVDGKEWSLGTGPSHHIGRLHLCAVCDVPSKKVVLGSTWVFGIPA